MECKWENGYYKYGTIFNVAVYKGELDYLYTGNFKRWQEHGQGKMTYADGTVKEGLWGNGEFIGKE